MGFMCPTPFGVVLAVVLAGAPGPAAPRADRPQAQLVARAVIPPDTYRAGSPPAGAFLSATERAAAHSNGVLGPADGAYFSSQPVQGFSSMVPADAQTWWALSDNGFAVRTNSADYQLVIHRVDPRWRDPAGPRVLETLVLRDPERHIPWTIVCDPKRGTLLPAFAFNVLPPAPAACGPAPAERILTGFDLDPESFVRAPDGTFWISEEFGPFLVHVSRDGRVLEPPVPFPGVRSPQNPFLSLADRTQPERPTLAASRGPEGLAISPDGGKLHALLEGPVAGDDSRVLRIYVFEVAKRAFAARTLRVALEMPGQAVDLASLTDTGGKRVYPDAAVPPAGPVAIGELKALGDRRFLMIERDNLGDDLAAPRFKKLFLLEMERADERDGTFKKTLLLDLLAIPDPSGIGGDGAFFRMPFYTIESVHAVDDRTLLVACDNNFPFSSGRARSGSGDRSGPLAADATEMILVRLGTPLGVDRRLLPSGTK
jgi:hypothetical protein